MKTTTRLLALTAAAFAIGTGGLAQAQEATTTPTQTRPGMDQRADGQRGGHHHHGHRHGGPSAAQLGEHLDKLKTELKITEAQTPAFTQFATTVTEQAKAREARRAEMRQQMQAQRQANPGSTAAPDRQALRAQMKQQREADKAARDSARAALYAVLTPEQKALADQRMRGGERGRRGEHGGHHGGHGGHGRS